MRRWMVVLPLLLVALYLRFAGRHFQSWDFLGYTRDWYRVIHDRGWSAFGERFSDYTPPYLYALLAVSKIFPHLSGVVATKIPASVSDVACASLAAVILRARPVASLSAFVGVLL